MVQINAGEVLISFRSIKSPVLNGIVLPGPIKATTKFTKAISSALIIELSLLDRPVFVLSLSSVY